MRKFASLLILSLIVFVGCTTTAPTSDEVEFSANDFVMNNEFADGSWMYRITGEMPNPCYSFTVEELVAESFPEQVTFNIIVSEPSADEVCAQVIDTQTVSGELKVDENATFRIGTVEVK